MLSFFKEVTVLCCGYVLKVLAPIFHWYRMCLKTT